MPPLPARQTPPTASAGDLAAHLRSFDAEFDHVCRALRRQGIDPTEAEDLAQEVFVVAWRRWADFDARFPLRPWLIGIAVNVAHRHRRRSRPLLLAEALERPDESPPPEERYEAAETRQLVARALARLPERHRAVLALHDLEEIPVDEITRRWGMKRFTVYTRLRRARAALASEIARLEAQEAAAIEARRPRRALAWLLADVPTAVSTRLSTARGRAARTARALFSPTATKLIAVALFGALVTLAGLATRRSPSSDRAPLPASRSAARTNAVRPPAGLSTRAVPDLLVARPTQPALSVTAGDHLVGHWGFDEPIGSAAARDVSGNDHSCWLRGIDPHVAPTWVPGLRGHAIDLGFAGWLECPLPPLPRRPVGAITVAAWVKRGGNPIFHHAIAMRAMGAGRSNQFFFGFVDDKLTVSSSGWQGVVDAPVPDAPGRWMHVAFTHDEQHVVKLFRDGVLVGRRASRVHAVGVTDGPLLVGGGLRGNDRTRVEQHFEGVIDDLRLYDRALGDDELRALAAPPGD